MAEATRAVLAHLRDDRGWTRAVSYIAPDNERSVALAMRLGATNEGPCPAYEGPSAVPHDTWRHDLGAGVPAEAGEPTRLADWPVLDEDGLTLRAPSLADFPALCGYYSTDDARFVGGPENAVATWRRLATMLGHFDLRGFGMFAVEADGAFVGCVGGWMPPPWPEEEIGWFLFPAHRGRGLATRAALATRRHAYSRWGWATAISLIETANEPSKHVARRCGARCERMEDFRGRPTEIWRHPARDAAPAATLH